MDCTIDEQAYRVSFVARIAFKLSALSSIVRAAFNFRRIIFVILTR